LVKVAPFLTITSYYELFLERKITEIRGVGELRYNQQTTHERKEGCRGV